MATNIMTSKTYTQLLNSMDKKERNEGKEDFYTFISLEKKDNEPLHDFLINLIYSNDGIASGSNNLSYDILYDAINYLNDYTLKECKAFEVTDSLPYYGFASIWNQTRLEYINTYNDNEILSIAKDYNSYNLSEACATWYDEQVISTINKLQDYVKEN